MCQRFHVSQRKVTKAGVKKMYLLCDDVKIGVK